MTRNKQRLTAADLLEPMAWELAGIFCDEYCRFPFECANEDELNEKHCDNCVLITRLLYDNNSVLSGEMQQFL